MGGGGGGVYPLEPNAGLIEMRQYFGKPGSFLMIPLSHGEDRMLVGGGGGGGGT